MKLRLLGPISALFLCFAAWLLAGDASSSQPRPTKDELTGIWWPNEESQQEIRKRAPNAAMFEVELRSDGRFSFVNIPKWWRNVFGQPSGKLGGVSGRWTFQNASAGTEIFLEAFGLSMTLGVDDRGTPREIIVHVGDADRSIAIRLFRKSGELKEPNQSPEPTPTAGTSAAEQPLVPAAVVAHL